MGAVINKNTFKRAALYSKESPYWKEGAKSNHYGNHGFGGNRVKIHNVVCKNYSSCRLKLLMKNCRQMSGKSKARDRTNLGTGAAPIN